MHKKKKKNEHIKTDNISFYSILSINDWDEMSNGLSSVLILRKADKNIQQIGRYKRANIEEKQCFVAVSKAKEKQLITRFANIKKNIT